MPELKRLSGQETIKIGLYPDQTKRQSCHIKKDNRR